MANRTDPHADTVHGGNPQYLVDRIVRTKIYNDAWWKEHCFALTTETIIDKVEHIDYVGGTYGGRRRPAKFLCLVLKMLQIQPEEEVVLEYIKQTELKYLRALGILYLRLTSRAMTIYTTLEPLFADYRKLRYRDIFGKMSLIHMDEFVDWCLREESICDVTVPAIPKRQVLELSLDLEQYRSVLEDDLDDLEELEQQLAEEERAKEEAAARISAADAQNDGATAHTGVSGTDDVLAGSGGVTNPAVEEGCGNEKERARSFSSSGDEAKRSRSARRPSAQEKGRSREARRSTSRGDRGRRGRSASASRGRKGREKCRSRSRQGDARRKSRSRSDGEVERQRRKEKEREQRERDKEKERRDRQRQEKDKERDKAKEKANEPDEKEKKDKREKKDTKDGSAPEEKDVWKEAEEKEARRQERQQKKQEKMDKLEKREKEKWRMEKERDKKHKKDAKDTRAKGDKKEKDGNLSVDGWNDVRAQLGLKPLK